MTSVTSTELSKTHWTNWPAAAKLKLLAKARHRLWLEKARAPQVPPDSPWLVWYLRGGRGSGKTRAGAEQLAVWLFTYEPGDWMILAPTFGDAKKCMELPVSGLIDVLGGSKSPLIRDWNRGEGILHLANGARVALDGANDGAERVQGYNLRGAWCDEVGLWERWDKAWNYSLRQAIRLEPSRIIATGTPKMGHGLVAALLADPKIPCHVMRTSDNIENLNDAAIRDRYEELQGTTLGRQELDGEYIAALEGEILPRHAWEFFKADLPVTEQDVAGDRRLQRFDQIVHSWDTTWKAKITSDFVAGQTWGIRGPDRFLLAIYHEKATLEATVVAMLAQLEAARRIWPDVPQRFLIETAAWGKEAAAEVRKRVDAPVREVGAKGDKVMRAVAASPALESGHCWLPGAKDEDPAGRGYTTATPARVQAFVEECALFQMDMRHAHDDQVDAWSQMVNFTRSFGQSSRATIGRASGSVPRPGSLAGV